MNYLLLLLIFVTSSVFGQQSIESVDSIVLQKKYKSINVKDLSKEIAREFKTDLNKIRAFYMYVVNNIEYDMALSERVWSPKSKEERDSIVLWEVNRTIRTKKGICWDYSALFEKLCFFSGIESEQIGGTIRNALVISENFIDNHAWNSLKINGERKFIDCTFEFPDKYNQADYDKFFLVDPKEFIYRCFPIDQSKQYLKTPLDYKTFKKLPYTHNSFYAYKLKSLEPNSFSVPISKNHIYPISFTVNNIADLDHFEVTINGILQGIIKVSNSKAHYTITKVLKSGDEIKINTITQDRIGSGEYIAPCLTYKVIP